MKVSFFSFLLSILLLSGTSRAQVLAESFRSMTCLNCSDADKKFEDFITSHPQYKINIVYMHNLIPSPPDPFYYESDSGASVRMTMYNVISDPDMFISGYASGSGQLNESNWETTAAAPASSQYFGTLNATASVDNSGKLRVALHAGIPSKSVQVKPYVMLIESGIQYTNTGVYVNPDGTTWNNIFRAMMPGKTGGNAFTWSAAQDISFTYETAGRPWNLNNCKIYAFLQEVTPQADHTNGNTYYIDAFTTAPITKSSVKSIAGSTTGLFAPTPNPAQSFSRISYHLSNPSNVRIVISDNLGREVSTILDSFISNNESSVIFTPPHAESGIYYARLYVDGAFAGSQKIVFEP